MPVLWHWHFTSKHARSPRHLSVATPITFTLFIHMHAENCRDQALHRCTSFVLRSSTTGDFGWHHRMISSSHWLFPKLQNNCFVRLKLVLNLLSRKRCVFAPWSSSCSHQQLGLLFCIHQGPAQLVRVIMSKQHFVLLNCLHHHITVRACFDDHRNWELCKCACHSVLTTKLYPDSPFLIKLMRHSFSGKKLSSFSH